MGVKEWKFWLLPFPTTNGHDLLKVLSRVGSCTGRLQTGSILPVSAICLTAFAQKEVLGGQGTWALRCLHAYVLDYQDHILWVQERAALQV